MAVRSPCRYKLLGVSSITIINVLVLANIIKVSSVVLVGLRKHQQQQKHNIDNGYHSRPIVRGNESCLFVGSWVPDQSTTPLYDFSSCPVIDPQFNCQMYGRPDTDYLKYRWQPSNCQIPRFDGAEFVKRMRGKSIMFVGDSIGRNQWESLICMISSDTQMSMSINRGDTISSVKFLEYGLTVSFYKAPYLVDIDMMEGKRVLRLGDIRGNSNAWTGFGVDLLYFNTGHWWTHKGSLQGWDYVESDGRLYQDMDPLLAMEKALTTWAKWVDANLDVTKTTLFFQAISPSHYEFRWRQRFYGPRRFYGPGSESIWRRSDDLMNQRQIQSPPPPADVYAGSAFALSPSPRSVPLPSFFIRKDSNDGATRKGNLEENGLKTLSPGKMSGI
ncbi:Protein PMR5 [Striga hermonthica]|uniref:Protein PMR5 n=1 Tax=Striga hermonthica TaxID=68872 RepID=A0A9N7MI20_STRHE|nr:Protein PMR5 [Striga hermonthica]